jgi:hypothetical protein
MKALTDAAHGVVNGMNSVIRFFGDALVYFLIAAALALLAYIFIKKCYGEKSLELIRCQSVGNRLQLRLRERTIVRGWRVV